MSIIIYLLSFSLVRMKLVLIVGLLVVCTVVEGSMFPEGLKHTLHKWNLLSRCWGEENMLKYAVQIHKVCILCCIHRAFVTFYKHVDNFFKAQGYPSYVNASVCSTI